MIFSPPAMKNGRPSAAALMAIPAKVGAAAFAALRATFVMPAVAVRSAGSTTAIGYDCRVGAWIGETALFPRRDGTASQAGGASGMRSVRKYDGRLVNTVWVIRTNTV